LWELPELEATPEARRLHTTRLICKIAPVEVKHELSDAPAFMMAQTRAQAEKTQENTGNQHG
jgi:hypothetical protein